MGVDFKATWDVCKNCDLLVRSEKKTSDGRFVLFCKSTHARSEAEAPKIGLLLEATDKTPEQFTNVGPCYVPSECPKFTEQMFLDIERQEA